MRIRAVTIARCSVIRGHKWQRKVRVYKNNQLQIGSQFFRESLVK
jgi:hypothetical protein